MRCIINRNLFLSKVIVAAMIFSFNFSCRTASAGIVVSEFFTGRIQMFDEMTKAETTLAMAPGANLSGLAYSAANNVLYASALNQGGVYRFNAQTGSLLGFSQLTFGPGGMTVGSNGNVYVTDFGSNTVRVFDATLTNVVNTITVPISSTSGVGILNNGNVLVATPGGGVYRNDGNSTTLFSSNGAASAQIASDAAGNNIFIGHGLGQTNDVYRYNSSGALLGTITITDAMVNAAGGSSTGTSPSGVAFDSAGNLFVAALGRSNPGDAAGQRGGLFKFDVNGNLLDTFASGSNSYSGVVVITAVPEPGSIALVTLGSLASAAFMRRRKNKSQADAAPGVS